MVEARNKWKKTKKRQETGIRICLEQAKGTYMITSSDSIILNYTQLYSIILNHVEFGLNLSQFFSIFLNFSRFFSIFLDYVEICMEYIFVVLVPGLFFLNFSRFFSIFLDYVEICMDQTLVIVAPGSFYLNFSRLCSMEWNPKASIGQAWISHLKSAYARRCG